MVDGVADDVAVAAGDDLAPVAVAGKLAVVVEVVHFVVVEEPVVEEPVVDDIAAAGELAVVDTR